MKKILLLLLLQGPLFAQCTPSLFSRATGTFGSGSATQSVTLNTNANDLLIVTAMSFSPVTAINSVKDGAGQTYTQVPGSPGADGGSTGAPAIYYGKGSGSSTTITVTFANAASIQVAALDFAAGGCTATLDKAAEATGTGTAVTTPSLTPVASGELLFAFTAASGSTTAANSPWTLGQVYTGTANGDEYILSSTNTATAVNFTQSGGGYSAIEVAFSFAAAAGHSADLSWTASADAAANPSLTYNIYRAPAACSPLPSFTQIANGISATTYHDAGITTGTYCWYATAFLNGLESVPSNTTQGTVPAAGAPNPPTNLTGTIQP